MSKEDISTSVQDDLIKSNDKKSDLQETIDTLMNDKYKRRKTILNNEQVPLITSLDVIAQIYDMPFLKAWVDWYAEWRTSGDNGIGRQNIVDIAKWNSEKENARYTDMLSIIRGK